MAAAALAQAPTRADPRLIVPLDLPSVAEARAMVEALGDAVGFYKVGLELFAGGEGMTLARELKGAGKQVFLDWKLHDIGTTVQRAAAVLAGSGCDFLTVHGEPQVMASAVRGRGASGLKILAVTVLTSLDRGDLDDLGFKCDVEALVLSRARRALEAGCDGVVASGLELPAMRRAIDSRLLVVTPGIRPVENRPSDDQKRVVTVEQAFADGANYIVVGRPIRDAKDPRAAAEAIQQTIAQRFSAAS
ncbi:MAG: orotidine-5'-phosphate decarboxylase [Phenylobacterium sp.]|nr:orotidine-5'-phosphate decarboxylase [Phenylobacterium sp.]